MYFYVSIYAMKESLTFIDNRFAVTIPVTQLIGVTKIQATSCHIGAAHNFDLLN